MIKAQEKDSNFESKKEVVEYLLSLRTSTTQIFNEKIPLIIYQKEFLNFTYSIQIRKYLDTSASVFQLVDDMKIPYTCSLLQVTTIILARIKQS